jgi:hypothetical protein
MEPARLIQLVFGFAQGAGSCEGFAATRVVADQPGDGRYNDKRQCKRRSLFDFD